MEQWFHRWYLKGKSILHPSLHHASLVASHVPPTDAPLLVLEPKKWGLGRDEALVALGLVFIVCLALFVMLMIMCCLWRGRQGHAVAVNSMFTRLKQEHADAFKQLLNQRRKKEGNNKSQPSTQKAVTKSEKNPGLIKALKKDIP